MASPRKKSSSLIFAPCMKMQSCIAHMYCSCSLRICIGSTDTTSGGTRDLPSSYVHLTTTSAFGISSPPAIWAAVRFASFKKCNKVRLLCRLSHYERLYWLFLLGSELWNVGRRWRLWLSLLFLSSFDNCAFVVWRGVSRNEFSLNCFAHSLKKFQIYRIYHFLGLRLRLRLEVLFNSFLS